jgi:UDPglucose 6-dehydrogenase
MITVLGLGFVGLTTGLGFAKKGFKTYGIDVNKDRLSKLRNNVIPFHEPHLKEVLQESADKTFFLNEPYSEAIKNSRYIFLCVGTPGAEDGSADLGYVFKAIDQIMEVEFEDTKILIIKSTVPPSTISIRVKPYLERKCRELGRKAELASNPEFLREGYCWEDFIEPDRIVIGIDNDKVKEAMEEIYKPFNAPIHFVSFNTAEFIKYLSNTLLSTLISYSNEMSMIADSIGDINIPNAFKILHQDKRWFGNPASMSSYVYPGCGYGGYCLPKDTAALHSIAKNNGFDASILKSNLDTNTNVKYFIVNKIQQAVSTDSAIGILGLSFKPGSDDVRLSPTKDIIEKLLQAGYNKLIAYDPMANDVFAAEYPEINIQYASSLEDVLSSVENVLILTAWKEFKDNKQAITAKNVFDFRYIY